MASRLMDEDRPQPKRRAPAMTPEARELQLISMAMDEAERQIREHTASSQLLTHFAKLGSSREKKEQERLENENELLRKKIEGLEASVRVEALMDEALRAFRGYRGEPVESDEYDEYDNYE